MSSLFPAYIRSDLAFDRGEGSYLIDVKGERYLDFASGIAVNSLGHAHPEVVDTIKRQAEKLLHVSNLYTIPEQEALAERLCALTFADRVFVTNSGAEAVECAIKTARRYAHHKGYHERTQIITMNGSFHGRTLGTIAAAGSAKMLEGFAPALPGFDQVPFNDFEALKAAVTPATLGIMLEPIQGEGGLKSADKDYLKAIRELCDERDLVLIFDEVQCGMGRTGDLFAYQTFGVSPDVMALAKGIGSGFPLGACLATKTMGDTMGPGSHGSTYGGNPLACAVGLTVLNLIADQDFLNNVKTKARTARQKFSRLGDLYPHVFGKLRGEGLMIGLETHQPPTEVVASLRTINLLSVPAGDSVIRLLPPLNVHDDEIDIALSKLETYAQEQPLPKPD